MTEKLQNEVSEIFKIARKIIPEHLSKAHEWLYMLEDNANANPTNSQWRDTLRGFFRGLWAADGIQLEDLDDFDRFTIDKFTMFKS